MRILLLIIVFAISLNHLCFAKDGNADADILIYADKIEIAEKVSFYLQGQGLNVTQTDDIMGLKELNNIKLVMLIPVKGQNFPSDILLDLKAFVWQGGYMIGMHDILFKQKLLGEIFGGGAGVFPTDMLTPDLTITIRDPSFSHIMKDVPEEFVLEKEHATRTNYKPTVQRLFEMQYQSTDGKTKRYCAGWLNKYGKGQTFFFAPGHTEETRYNPKILKILANTSAWMLKMYAENNINVITKKASDANKKSMTLSDMDIEDSYGLLSSLNNAGSEGNDYVQGKMDGSILAKGDKNWALAGIFGPFGVLTAFVYPQEPPISALSGKTREYAFGFTESYRSECRNKNGGYALGGWLVSWIIFYVIAVTID